MACAAPRFLLPALLATSVCAQSIWLVGEGQPHNIASGAAAAANGDILLVQSLTGTWFEGGFTLDKGVTVRGPAVVMGSWSMNWSGSTTLVVQSGAVAVLERITFGFTDGGPAGPGPSSMTVRSGTVLFRECSFDGTIRVDAGASAVLERCTVRASSDWDAWITCDGHLELRDCTVRGSDAGCIYGPGLNCVAGRPAKPAVLITRGSLHVERTTLAGGAARVVTAQHLAAQPALRMQSGNAWLSSSTLSGGADATGWPFGGAVPASAIVNSSSSPIALDGVTLIPGGAGVPPAQGPIDLTASLVQLVVPALSLGATTTLTVSGDPGEVVALLWAPDASPTTHPLVAQPLWFLSGVTIAGGSTDGSGAWSLPLAVPNLPGLRHARVQLQAIGGNGTAIRASTLSCRLVD
ncbi:MAG: hypothetical protein HZB39_11880 [Planctomycetes bacterium]|nr:hypothetical protein [Planctomycetota bacterium]